MVEQRQFQISGRTAELLSQRYPKFVGIDERIIVGHAQDIEDPDVNLARAWIYDRYYPDILGIVRRRTSQSEDVEDDIAQDTLLKVFANIERFSWRGKGSFGGWVVKIAINTTADLFRRNRIRQSLPIYEHLVSPDVEQLTLGSTEKTPQVHVENQETYAELRERVSHLSTAQREVVELRYFGQFSVSETARRLGKTEVNVRVLTHKGVRKLRTLMPQTG